MTRDELIELGRRIAAVDINSEEEHQLWKKLLTNASAINQ